MSKLLFYDTCSLLTLQGAVFDTEEVFYISSITLNELENIKTSGQRDEEIKYNARNLLRLLDNNINKYKVILYNSKIDNILTNKYDLPITSDSKIIATALYLRDYEHKDIVFISDDLLCKHIALAVGLNYQNIEHNDEKYTGFKTVNLTDEELANFYSTMKNNNNQYNLLENEYLIIQRNNQVIDQYKWKNGTYTKVPFHKFESKMFGKIGPKDNDIYQQLAIDSLTSNQITLLRGPAGSGKSYLALACLFSMLEKGTIDHIIIFCNTVATKGSAKLGYYPGSRTEKLLDSQIGNFLESKIGEKGAVETMIDKGQIILLPMADIRGYDTSDMNAAVYITEAQNLDIELMKLALQRIGEDSICILDGDSDAQVDMSMYAGNNNGMRRVSEVFRGEDIYGEVELQTIYRSKIADIAKKL